MYGADAGADADADADINYDYCDVNDGDSGCSDALIITGHIR